MTNFIPIFPLAIVLYPGEQLNLHVFEPRYKQLIQESVAHKKPFGIPTVIDNRLQEFGSLATVQEIYKQYDNGEMDIKAEGGRVFRILELIAEVPKKLYSGAIVSYPEKRETGNTRRMSALLKSVRRLHELLQLNKDFKKPDPAIRSFDVSHHVGLSLEEEYEILQLHDERQRQEYLSRHLTKAISLVGGIDQLKEKIKLNGHFKNISGFPF